MRTSFSFVLVAVFALLAAASPASGRIWTNTAGRTVEADFVGFQDGKVRIRRAGDDKEFEIPLDSLSDEDQQFVLSQPAPAAPATETAGPDAAMSQPAETAAGPGETTEPAAPPADEPAEPPPQPAAAPAAPPPAAAQPDASPTALLLSTPALIAYGAVAGAVVVLLLVLVRRRRPAAGGGSAPAVGTERAGPSRAGTDFAQRAQALIGEPPPKEQQVAEDSSYCSRKISEFQQLCELASEACRKGGNQAAVGKINTIRNGMTTIMKGWSIIRSQVQGNPMLVLHITGVTLLLTTTWNTLVGAIRFYGLQDGASGFASEAKLVENINASAEMVTIMLGKWGLQ